MNALSNLLTKESLQNPVILAGLVVVALAIAAVLGSAGTLTRALIFEPKTSLFLNDRNAGATRSAINANDINQRNFFGLASDRPTVAIESLPETQLKLVLRGAFAAADENEAGAIIEDERQIAEQYGVGDELPGNATLNAVYTDRVVLARNGLLETLYFPDDFSDAGVGTRNNEAATPTSATTPQDDSEAAARREAIRERIRELRGR